MPASQEIDREELFRLLARREWDTLAEIVYANQKLFRSDLVIQQVLRLFESEFFSYVGTLTPAEKLPKLKHIGLIIEENRSAFSSGFVENFIDVKLQALRDTNSPTLVGFANSYRDRPLARQLLAELQKSHPEQIAIAQRPNLSLRATETTQGRPKVTSLFKSQQEQDFYEAVRLAFPTFLPYPNVALSCFIDFNQIAHVLEPRERDYFFKAIVDCVVFDSSKSYEPLYFFELDSSFHDAEQARANDAIKDKIFRAANTKLMRIRAPSKDEATVEKFRSLVLDLMRGS